MTVFPTAAFTPKRGRAFPLIWDLGRVHRVPFGGSKQSGLGREGGRYFLDSSPRCGTIPSIWGEPGGKLLGTSGSRQPNSVNTLQAMDPVTRQFTALIEREEDGYVALCPELDIASQGDSIEEARENLREALELFFETASPTEIRQRRSRPCARIILFRRLSGLSDGQ